MDTEKILETMNFIEDGCGDLALKILHKEIKNRNIKIKADSDFHWHKVEDNSSKIIENIKWFLYDDGSLEIIKNEFGFEHETEFVSWVGDGHSFIIKDDTGEYRISISKELE